VLANTVKSTGKYFWGFLMCKGDRRD